MTFFQIGAVLFRPLAGMWIDEFNKRKMLLLSLGVFLLVTLMYMGVSSFYALLGIRILHGAVFAIGTATVATLVALVLPSQRRGEGIGYYAVFANLAMVVGPFFGLIIIAHFKFDILFSGCVVLAALALLCGRQNNLHGVELPQPHGGQRKFSLQSFIEPKAMPMALMGGLVFFAYSGVLVLAPIYAKQLNITDYTSAFFIVFALAIIVTRPFVGRLFDKSGPNAVIYPGFMIFALGLFVLSQIQSGNDFLLAGSIIGVGFGALSPAFQTLAIQNSPRNRAGVATATYFLALDISVGLGAFLLSLVALQAGYRAMYIFTAVMTVVTTIAYYLLWRQKIVFC